MNSTLMQLVSSPPDLSPRSEIGRVFDSIEKTVLRLSSLLILLDQSPNGFGHKARHRLIARGCINTQPPQQGLCQTRRDVLMSLQEISLSREHVTGANPAVRPSRARPPTEPGSL